MFCGWTYLNKLLHLYKEFLDVHEIDMVVPFVKIIVSITAAPI